MTTLRYLEPPNFRLDFDGVLHSHDEPALDEDWRLPMTKFSNPFDGEIGMNSKQVRYSLIQDHGVTEFGGVLTYTAVAIGPATADSIAAITGALGLL